MIFGEENGSNRLRALPRSVWGTSFLVLALAALPFILGSLQSSSGARYVGFQYNTDDHMVYAAWMRQAADGRFFFDNRFTTDAQPGLTVHLYFLALGWLSRVLGIALAANAARIVLSGAFLVLLYRMIRRLGWEDGEALLGFTVTTLGSGLGFLVWQNFGTTIVKPVAAPLSGLLLSQLPVDVWQPEGFVFPSMLTNGLFMVSLCLILLSYDSFIQARHRWTSVLTGFACIGLLMNIHSYDVLTIGLVMTGFGGASLWGRQVSIAWLGKAALIACGAALPALWFVHVLQLDPVFRSRASTETFSPNFRAAFFGYMPLVVLGLFGAFRRGLSGGESKAGIRMAAIALVAILLVVLLLLAGSSEPNYFLGPLAWGGVYVTGVVAVCLWSDEDPYWNLLFSWAVLGTVAIYFPSLFQRKLAMGLSIPWALLATHGLWSALSKLEAGARRLCLVLGVIVTCATSLLWVLRETEFIKMNVANTTRHPVFLDEDTSKIIDLLNAAPGGKVVLALPGAGTPNFDQEGKPIPDSFSSPVLPDLAPLLTGLTGSYSYAGHWSETPEYTKRASDMYRFFLAKPFQSFRRVMSDEERRQFAARIGANFAVLPSVPEVLPTVAPSSLGDVLYEGRKWSLVRLHL